MSTAEQLCSFEFLIKFQALHKLANLPCLHKVKEGVSQNLDKGEMGVSQNLDKGEMGVFSTLGKGEIGVFSTLGKGENGSTVRPRSSAHIRFR